MSKIDAKGNIHGRDGRFLSKHTYNDSESDAVIIELKKKEPLVVDAAQMMDYGSNLPTVSLPVSEYRMVMSNLATNLTQKEYDAGYAKRDISNHRYYVLVRGFGDYSIIGKSKIRSRTRKRRKNK